MKFEPKNKDFQPIEVTITIESQEEKSALITLLGYNLSVPRVAFEEESTKFNIIKDFMRGFKNAIIAKN